MSRSLLRAAPAWIPSRRSAGSREGSSLKETWHSPEYEYNDRPEATTSISSGNRDPRTKPEDGSVRGIISSLSSSSSSPSAHSNRDGIATFFHAILERRDEHSSPLRETRAFNRKGKKRGGRGRARERERREEKEEEESNTRQESSSPSSSPT